MLNMIELARSVYSLGTEYPTGQDVSVHDDAVVELIAAPRIGLVGWVEAWLLVVGTSDDRHARRLARKAYAYEGDGDPRSGGVRVRPRAAVRRRQSRCWVQGWLRIDWAD
jgi:hypothetical protein